MIWTKEQDDILREYFTARPNKEIVYLVNRTEKSIRSRASYLGLLKSYRKITKKWTTAEEQLLKEVYPDLLREELVDIFSTDFVSIKNKAQDLGLKKSRKTVFREMSLSSHNKKVVDHSFFNEVNTESKAYFLGLLWADGCVTENPHRVQLKMLDRHIIEEFKKVIASSHSISEVNEPLGNFPYFSISFTSKQMVEDLARYGIIPRKSYANINPPSLNKQVIRHFVRGIFDGDGCVTGSGTNIHVNICGSEATCKWVLDLTRTDLVVGGGLTQRSAIWVWQLGGKKQVSKFANWMYRDSSFFLSRKYNKFVEEGLL